VAADSEELRLLPTWPDVFSITDADLLVTLQPEVIGDTLRVLSFAPQ